MPVRGAQVPRGSSVFAALSDPTALARARAQWIAARATGERVLVLGSEAGAAECDLVRHGKRVELVEPRLEAFEAASKAIEALPAVTPGRIELRRIEPIAAEWAPASFDSCLISDLLVQTADPAALIECALHALKPDGTLAISIPLAGYCDRSALHSFHIQSLATLLRPRCGVEHISATLVSIRFVGHPRSGPESGWSAYSEEWMWRTAESALELLNKRLLLALQHERNEHQRLLDSARYRLGDLLINSVRRPAAILGLPAELYRLATRRHERRVSGAARSTAVHPDFPAFPVPAPLPGHGPVILSILDRFSEFCWRYEGQLIPLLQQSWEGQLRVAQPQMFLMESAWEGNGGDWSALLSDQTQTRLRQIIETCRGRGIPAVFWNKDDPPNFDRFAATAAMFDHVFTTDENCIPAYRKYCAHDRVASLPFAAQPAIHNPMRPDGLSPQGVCFAGTWFAEKYPDRARSLQALLDPALERGLHIFDRHAPESLEKYQYPAKYRAAIKGSLGYEQMLAAYRSYSVILSVNSVADSPTMFSRRVLEALACGTPVISSPSIGMEKMLGGAVRVAATAAETRAHLDALLGDPELRDSEGHLGYRRVHRHHTYAHLLADIHSRIGVPASGVNWPRVSILVATHRPHCLDNALDNFAKQTYPDRELILILNKAAFDVSAVQERASRAGNVRVIRLDENQTLGQCLNAGLALSDGAYVAKMDDDDLYGPEYLWDLVLAAKFSRADVTGKGVYHTYVAGRDQMGLRIVSREHGMVNRDLAGGTLLIRRGVFDSVKFPSVPKGTDTAFLLACQSEGHSFYSADRYNYVMMRQSDPAKHTWQIDDDEVLRLCKHVRTGLDLKRAMI